MTEGESVRRIKKRVPNDDDFLPSPELAFHIRCKTIFILMIFFNRLFLQSPANPDLLYIIFFCHVQLTMTLLLCLIFGSKVSNLAFPFTLKTRRLNPNVLEILHNGSELLIELGSRL